MPSREGVIGIGVAVAVVVGDGSDVGRGVIVASGVLIAVGVGDGAATVGPAGLAVG